MAPFLDQINDVDFVLNMDKATVNNMLIHMRNCCNQVTTPLRPNKIYIHNVDIDYTFPEEFSFIDMCKRYVDSSGIIVFQHLNNFEVVKKFLKWYPQDLGHAQHPITGDSIWHLNPFLIDMMQAEIHSLYNFRGETPNERRLLAELLNFPVVEKIPLDVENAWTENTMVYVDRRTTHGEPLSLCKFIRRNGPKV